MGGWATVLAVGISFGAAGTPGGVFLPGDPAWENASPEARTTAVSNLVSLLQNPLNVGLVKPGILGDSPIGTLSGEPKYPPMLMPYSGTGPALFITGVPPQWPSQYPPNAGGGGGSGGGGSGGGSGATPFLSSGSPAVMTSSPIEPEAPFAPAAPWPIMTMSPTPDDSWYSSNISPTAPPIFAPSDNGAAPPSTGGVGPIGSSDTPEPGTLLLAGLGLAVVGVRFRR